MSKAGANRWWILLPVLALAAGLALYLSLPARPTDNLPVHAPAPKNLPEFTLGDISGKRRNIAEWAGKPLLINFWATWCAPCRRELPLLEAFNQSRADHGVQVIGIAIDRLSDAQTFADESGITYPNLVGQEDAMAVSDLFGPETLALPFSVATDAQGNILKLYVGELHPEVLEQIAAVSRQMSAQRMNATAAREFLEKSGDDH